MRQIYEYHPKIGFRFVPGLRARVEHEGGGYLFRANDAGFRCPHPFESARTEGKRRVLLFGDSFTAGEGVSDGQRYGDHLEKLIEDVEVFNFGMPATGTDQHFLIYEEFAKDIEHDLLILAIFVENIRRVNSRYRYFQDDSGKEVLYAKPYFTLESGSLELHGVPPAKQPIDIDDLSEEERSKISARWRYPRFKRFFDRLRNNKLFEKLFVESGLKDRLQKWMRYQPINEYDDAESSKWLLMRAVIENWISNHDKPVMVLPIPLYHHVADLCDGTSYQARLREATEAAGGTFVDPLDELKKSSIGERKQYYFPIDGHLTRTGHEALAQAIAGHVGELLSSQTTGAKS